MIDSFAGADFFCAPCKYGEIISQVTCMAACVIMMSSMIERRMGMEAANSYTLALQGFTYKVCAEENAPEAEAVFARLSEEMAAAKDKQPFLTQHETLLIAALNITHKLLDLEKENKLLLDLFDIESN